MPPHHVDIAIIGAGSAGISALKLIRQHTDDFLLIDKGALGTTCARVGCMPSKALVEIAGHYRQLCAFNARGLMAGDPQLPIDGQAVMAEVRRLRDYFSNHMRQQTLQLSEGHFIRGSARMIDANTIDVDGERITARAIILAVGSRPVWPAPWRGMAQRLLDSERFFELATVPPELTVLGLGSIGLELGQACGLLGSRVYGVDMQQRLGCLTDPAAIRHAGTALAGLSLSLGHSPRLQDHGSCFEVSYADQRHRTEHVLLSAGRCDNLDHLDMAPLLTGRSVDPTSLQLGDLPVFIAGDSAGGAALLHEAVDEGQIAARNALSFPQLIAYQRRVPLQITFTQPQLATVGCRYAELDIHSALIAEAPLAGQGRVVLAGGGGGVLRLYADSTGMLLGAELVSPQAEHLAHLIAAWLTAQWSVGDALRLPFYHPTLEEGLRSALLQLAKKLGPTYYRPPGLALSPIAGI